MSCKNISEPLKLEDIHGNVAGFADAIADSQYAAGRSAPQEELLRDALTNLIETYGTDSPMWWQARAALATPQPSQGAQPVVDQKPASMSDNGSCGSQVSGKPVSAEATPAVEYVLSAVREMEWAAAGKGLTERQALDFAGRIRTNALAAPSALPAQAVGEKAKRRDALFNASIEFIGTLTGMKPPPIEVAPPAVFAPFHAFVEKVEAIIQEHQ